MLHAITNQPVAIPGLVVGSRYRIQNRTTAAIFVAASAPGDPPDDGRIFESGAGDNFKLPAGMSLWVWLLQRSDTEGQVHIELSIWL